MALTKIDDRGLNTPIDLLDNEKIRFGDATTPDTEIYHNGTHTYINHVGTGDLILQTETNGDDIKIYAKDDIYINPQGGENGLTLLGDGEVQLFYDGSGTPKFETTSTGVKYTGDLRADDDYRIKLGSSQELNIYHHNSGVSVIENTDQVLKLRAKAGEDGILINPDGAVQLFNDGGGPKFETTANGAKVTGSAGSYALEINHPDWNTLKLINTNANDYGPYLDMYHNSASPADGDEAGEIRFLANDDAGGTVVYGQMRVVSYDVSNDSEDGQFELQLRNHDVLEEKLRIRSGGQVCIGTTDGPGEPGLYLGDGTNPAAHIYANGSDHLYILANAYYNGGWKYQGSGHGGSLTIGDGDLVFNTAPTGSAGNAITWAEVFRAKNSNGDLSLTTGNLVVASGKGIDFGANANATGNTSNLLDDYESGTWTATMTTGTCTSTSCKYIKIGNQCTVWGRISNLSDTSTNIILRIEGLPYACNVSNAAGNKFSRHISADANCAYVTTSEDISFYGGNSANDWLYVTHLSCGTGTEIYFYATYRTEYPSSN